MQLIASAVDAAGETAAIRDVGEVEVPGPAWGGKGVRLRGGEGARGGGGEAGGPIMTASESVLEAVTVGVLVRTTVPVIGFAFSIAVVAGVVLPAIVNIVVKGEVVEDCERVVGADRVWFEGFSRGERVDICRFVD